jgi:3-mercaptopyruvate sulfurtransferase SseA
MIKKVIQTLFIIFLASPFFLACTNPSGGAIVALTAKQARPLLEKYRGNSDFILLDIRTPQEYAQGHIPHAVLLDYYHPSFKASLQRLDRNKTYLIYCRSGNRSSRTLNFIQSVDSGRSIT